MTTQQVRCVCVCLLCGGVLFWFSERFSFCVVLCASSWWCMHQCQRASLSSKRMHATVPPIIVRVGPIAAHVLRAFPPAGLGSVLCA